MIILNKIIKLFQIKVAAVVNTATKESSFKIPKLPESDPLPEYHLEEFSDEDQLSATQVAEELLKEQTNKAVDLSTQRIINSVSLAERAAEVNGKTLKFIAELSEKLKPEHVGKKISDRAKHLLHNHTQHYKFLEVVKKNTNNARKAVGLSTITVVKIE